jgi:tripartite-type tricarboxylate transporter receptor subunit TctC
MFALSLAVCAQVACAQDYPSKTVRIVTSGAGSGGDFTARIIAQGVAPALGQSVIVDNRAGSLIASETASKAPPDGYTLLVNGASFWVIPFMQKVSYDPVRDFTPISLAERGSMLIAVHPSVPVRSIKELIALARSKPGELNYGASGIGGPTHLAGELFKSMTGVNIVAVPYKGGTGPTVTALLTGEVHMTMMDTFLMVPHAKAGRMRALAVTGPEPSAIAPGIPTVAASGVPGFEATPMTGVWAPVKTSAAIVNRLNQEVVRVLQRPDTKERYLSVGVDVVGTTPEQFAQIMKNEIAKTSKTIKDAGIKTE